ncbi:MAG TPA: hypothetical protein VGN37_02780 [Actinocatenispora sp.]
MRRRAARTAACPARRRAAATDRVVRRTGVRLYRMAVDVYRRHRPGVTGRCAACGRVGCSARRHAAAVLAALGDDPRRYGVAPFGGGL